MIKKPVLSLLLVSVLFIGLCGCQRVSSFNQPEANYLVSAIGFDGEDGKYRVSIEVVTISEYNTSANISPTIYTGKGNSIEQAMNAIYDDISKRLAFSHCAIVALGKGLTAKQTEEIYYFCSVKEDITLAVRVVSTGSAEKLLKCEAESNPLTGYDVIGVLKQNSILSGQGINDRLYQIQTVRFEPLGVYGIPHFRVIEKENRKDIYTYEGIQVMRGNEELVLLDDLSSSLFLIFHNMYGSGKVIITTSDGTFNVPISKTGVKVSFEYKDDRLRVLLKIKIRLEHNDSAMRSVETLSAAVKTAFDRYIEEHREFGDIFEIGTAIAARDKPLWKEIKNDYVAVFSRAEITTVYDIK